MEYTSLSNTRHLNARLPMRWVLIIWLLTALHSYADDVDHAIIGFAGGYLIGEGVASLSPDDKWAQIFIPTITMLFVNMLWEGKQFAESRGNNPDMWKDTGIAGGAAAFGAAIRIDW